MEWRPISEIPGYEDYTNYELNIAGDLRNRKTGRLRKWSISHEYLMTNISQNGLRENIWKHIAICRLFKPNPDNKPIIDHWNRNTLDNSFDNLRWVTSEENMHNRSINSNNKTGASNIYSAFKHGKPMWEISIRFYGQKHWKYFPRDPNSDVIPQEVIDYRDWMKRTYHPTSVGASYP
jgi:hypothetical protein